MAKGTQLSINQLVLIRQPNLAPLQWAMGRIQEVHPGPDGIARTATVKIAKDSYVRPLSKLSIIKYQFKSNQCIIKHLVLSAFSYYLLIISFSCRLPLRSLRMSYYFSLIISLAYLDINTRWFSVHWLNLILNRIRVICVSCYANSCLYVTLKVNPFKAGGVFGISMIHNV